MLACSALLPRLPIGLNWRRCGPSCAPGRRQIARCSHSYSHRTLGIEKRLEAPPGFEPGVEVLQTSALPLGDGAPETTRPPSLAPYSRASSEGRKMERETGFEPATSTLARSHSTTELFPPERPTYHTAGLAFKRSVRLKHSPASRSARDRGAFRVHALV